MKNIKQFTLRLNDVSWGGLLVGKSRREAERAGGYTIMALYFARRGLNPKRNKEAAFWKIYNRKRAKYEPIARACSMKLNEGDIPELKRLFKEQLGVKLIVK